MTEAELTAWLVAYGSAWERRDPIAASALFAEDAAYFETPFQDPERGRDGVRRYWESVTVGQRDVRFSYEVLGVVGDTGFARWRAAFTRTGNGERAELDGVFVLRYDGQGLCRELREWWHRSTD